MKTIRIICLAAVFMLLALSLGGCSGGQSGTEAAKISFKSAASYSYLKGLDQKQVTINGYLATSSPADGSFIFLMNMPYQSCPFCKPNTSQLSNTMEVYPKSGQKFGFTTQAVCVTGKLEVSPSESESFTDPFGYEFNFRIVDADYVILKDSDLTAEMAAWQKIADSGIINDVYAMFEYVNFVCTWPQYYVNSTTLPDGTVEKGYFLYAADALNYLQKEGAQWSFGYQRDYSDKLVTSIQKVDANAFSSLIEIIREAEALARRAESDLENGEYTFEQKYVDKFEQEDYIYTLNNAEQLEKENDEVFLRFSDWLGTWEV